MSEELQKEDWMLFGGNFTPIKIIAISHEVKTEIRPLIKAEVETVEDVSEIAAKEMAEAKQEQLVKPVTVVAEKPVANFSEAGVIGLDSTIFSFLLILFLFWKMRKSNKVENKVDVDEPLVVEKPKDFPQNLVDRVLLTNSGNDLHVRPTCNVKPNPADSFSGRFQYFPEAFDAPLEFPDPFIEKCRNQGDDRNVFSDEFDKSTVADFIRRKTGYCEKRVLYPTS